MILPTLIILSALWIYWDATKNKIGKIEGNKSFDNLSAGAWYFCTLLLWIVTLPYYLIRRAKLINIAKDQPVVTKNSTAKITLISILSALLIFSMALATFQAQSSRPGYTEVGFGDITVRPDELHQEKIIISGALMIIGNQFVLTNNLGGNTPIAIDLTNFTREQQAQLINNCSNSCFTKVSGEFFYMGSSHMIRAHEFFD